MYKYGIFVCTITHSLCRTSASLGACINGCHVSSTLKKSLHDFQTASELIYSCISLRNPRASNSQQTSNHSDWWLYILVYMRPQINPNFCETFIVHFVVHLIHLLWKQCGLSLLHISLGWACGVSWQSKECWVATGQINAG